MSEILLAAKDVVGSLNKNLLFQAPVDEQETEKLSQTFLAKLPFLGIFPSPAEGIVDAILGKGDWQTSPLPGLSGDKAIGIYKGEEFLYLLKFTNPHWHLAKELYAIHQFQALGLQESDMPQMVTAGTYRLTEKDEIRSFFIQTAVKGKPLSRLLEELGSSPGSGRQQKLKLLKDAVQKVTTAFVELHQKKRSLALPVPKELSNYHLNMFRILASRFKYEVLDKEKIDLSLEEFGILKQRLTRSAMTDNWGMTSFTHGDSHVEHLFFDPTLETVSLIDLSSFIFSINEKEEPVGFAPHDFSWIWCTIAYYGIRFGVTEEEIESLLTLLTETYETKMGEDLNPLAVRQLSIAIKLLGLLIIAFGLKNSAPLAPQEEERVQKVISYLTKRFKQL